MKTILSHLNTLSEPERTEAIHNTWVGFLDEEVPDIEAALNSFIHADTPQGSKYWKCIIRKYRNR